MRPRAVSCRGAAPHRGFRCMHTEQPKGGAYAWISAVEDSLQARTIDDPGRSGGARHGEERHRLQRWWHFTYRSFEGEGDWHVLCASDDEEQFGTAACGGVDDGCGWTSDMDGGTCRSGLGTRRSRNDSGTGCMGDKRASDVPSRMACAFLFVP